MSSKITLIDTLTNIIKQNNFDFFIVGGTVRDTLLGKEITDTDLVSCIPLKELENILSSNFIIKDISKNKKENIYMIKDTISEEIVELSLTDNLLDNLSKRDFTINSLAMSSKGIVDEFNGIDDLNNKIIRCVGNPDDTFKADYIRMIRAIRFSIKYDFTIEENTYKSIKENAKFILSIDGERIYHELLKIAKLGNVKFKRFIEMLDETNLLEYIFPEIKLLQDCLHKEIHHPEGDAYVHTLYCLSNSYYTEDLKLLLSILYHDSGKSMVYNKEKLTYYGHDSASKQLIENMCLRLRIPNKIKECMLFCGGNHMKMHDFMKMRKFKAVKLMNDILFEELLFVSKADSLARDINHSFEELDEYINTLKNEIDIYETKDGKKKIKLDISGDDIKGILKTIKIGNIISHLEKCVIEKRINNNKKELISETDKYLRNMGL